MVPPIQRPAVRRAVAAVLAGVAWVVGAGWEGGPGASGPVWSVVRLAAALTCVLAAAQLAWRPFVPSLERLRQVSIVGLLLPIAVMTFLLPPFEVPDEEVHWMLSLKYFRADVAGEPSAYQLSETIFDSSRLHFRPDEKFDARRLDTPKAAIDRIPAADLDAKHQWWRKNYPYAMPFAYPVEAAMFALFPKIHEVRQAEILFYLCRLASAGLLLGLLWALNRRFQLPFTAVFFFSLPLVVQQSASVSSDVLLTCGTLAILWLFLTAHPGPEGPGLRASRPDPGTEYPAPGTEYPDPGTFRSRVRLAVTWLLALAIVAMKVMLAGVLLLPLALTLRDRIRRPGRWVMAGAALGLVAAYPAFQAVLYQVRAYGNVQGLGPIIDQQVANLGTGGGLQMFVAVYFSTMQYASSLAAWAGPLGWVDTVLDPVQISLLHWSLWIAVVLDAIVYGPRLVSAIRARATATGWVAAAIAVSVLFVTVTDVLIYFLISTPGDMGVRVQVRHFFPIVAMALILPVAVLPKPEERSAFLVPTAAVVFTVVLLLARTIMLAIDLLVRYW
jgi:hypothetical protein